MVSRNFSRVSRFPEKGVIFPPLTSVVLLSVASVIFLLVVFAVVDGPDFFCSNKASKNHSVGVLSSGEV